MDVSKKELTEYITNYLNAIKKLVDNNRQEIESINIIPNFPTKFPVKTSVFFGRKGIFIKFEESENFSISFNRNVNPPVKKGEWKQIIFYTQFKGIKDKASEKAKSDFNYFLSIPTMIEEHEKSMQEYYDALYFEAQNYELDNYLDYLKNTKKVVDETKNTTPQELLDIITVIQKHLSNYEYMLIIGANCLDCLHFMINSDLETSLFLAINGKYYSAIAILRKVLEVNIKSIYCDTLPNTAPNKNKIDDWLNRDTSPVPFATALNVLFKDNVDTKLTSLLKKLALFGEASLKKSISSLYSELCIYVHLRPTMQRDEEFELAFSEFNLHKLENYYRLFGNVTKFVEILLVTKFPKIVAASGIGSDTNTYAGLQISRGKLEALAKFNSV